MLGGDACTQDTGQVCSGPQVWRTSPSATWHLFVWVCVSLCVHRCLHWVEGMQDQESEDPPSRPD